MSYNPVYANSFTTDARSEFDKKGHPGKFHQSITCGTGTTTFTGSYFGVGGLIVPNGCTGTASFSNGGSIPLGTIASSNPVIHEFSVSSVKVDSGTIYALVRNQLIR